ncbi:hypothetical protein ACJMK2_019453 [Sinanodonta woodiana]|uniref:Integrator complex subunit 4 n=1 Tax=Sinanodonta woodiana TaxID=1069815 RepID=A0ABD3UGG5_SINWO
MAALLKKRAVAEFSSVIQEEQKPVKRLKLVQKPLVPDISLSLQTVTTPHEALQVLLRFENSLPVESDATGNVLRELLDHYSHEKEAVVRWKIASLIASLSKLPGGNLEGIAEDVISLLKSEESNKVVAKLVTTLTTIGRSGPSCKELHQRLIGLAKQHLGNSSHLVRSSCLQLIGALTSPCQQRSEVSSSDLDSSLPSIQSLLSGFTHDQDPRVRSAAFEALLQLHHRGLQLEQGMYQQAVAALTDDYEGVRLVAVKLVWVLSHLYPESLVNLPDSNDRIRLVDDAFAKICNMVNDISMKVRAEACSLLGSLHMVSERFLEQTLDKKLMSNMRRKRSAHERAKELFQSGEWATGQKWADDAPKDDVDPENISLMNIGACGAFVHGLEDEFAEVRNTALDSLCELAAQSANFARLSQDSIIDMFNDEIESVRLNAINSLKKLSQHLELREDQLDIILGVLQDFSYTCREYLRDMLCEMKVATKDCLNACMVSLLDNLRRYPQDKTSIWKCMQHLGRNHPHLALPLVPDLLCLHPYFDSIEPDMDDPAYVGVLVLVFNAAAGNRTALPMFQEHTWRHYTYLRDSIPHMVPDLKNEGGDARTVGESSAWSSSSTVDFLQQRLRQLEQINSMDPITAQQMLQSTVRDIERLQGLDSRVSASAECMCKYLQTQLLLSQLQNQHQHIISGSVTVNHFNAVVQKILKLTNGLQTVFAGIGNEEIALIRQTELKALTFHLVSMLGTSQELAVQLKAQEGFTAYLAKLQKFLQTSDIKADAFTSYLFSEIDNIKKRQFPVVQKSLQAALLLIKPVVCPLGNQVRKATAIIHEPSGLTDNAVKFTAGLTTAVMMDAELENIHDVSSIRIQVCYPDMTTELIVPPAKDVKKLGPLRHRLLTNVILSHGLWSESCQVEISVVMMSSAVSYRLRYTKDTETNVVELGKPVKVLVSPKQAKR